MKLDLRSRGWRIAVGIAVPAAVAAGAIFLYFFKAGPPCPIYALSGIYCPGCGAGRACVALLHGDVLGALNYNPLFMLMLPFFAYYALKVYIAYVFGKDALPFPKVGWGIAVAVVAAVLLFWVLRNIRLEPFIYLSP